MAEECANPLLLGWIKEWLDQARERNSKGFTTYKKAYESMKACPLTFTHPSEAQQLHGLGPKLCERLADKLKAHCLEHGLPMPELPSKAKKRPSGDDLPSQQAKKIKKPKPYVPTLRSGPYALMLGLATLDEHAQQGLTKAQLIEAAQPHCDSSFTAPSDPTKYYTAWNSMKTLVQKDLVYEHGRPQRKYALTEEGWEIAKKIKKTTEVNTGGQTSILPALRGVQNEDSGPSNPTASIRTNQTPAAGRRLQRGQVPNDFEFLALSDAENGLGNPRALAGPESQNHRATGDNTTALPTDVTPITLPPGSFTIELVLDVREVRSSTDRDYIANELSKKGISPQVRALELGDALWVAKCRDPDFLARHGEEGDEIMLDWILERKRLDDLIGSIKDGRFHEQKFRLRRSGMQNVVYLVEEFSVSNDTSMKYQDMVASAIASTQVVNGYFVKKTKNLDDSIRYLARLTNLLRRQYGCEGTSHSPLAASATPPTPMSHTSPSTPTLSFIPTKFFTSQTYLPLLTHFRTATQPSTPTTHTITFSTFSALCSKSDVLALRDVFLKMLMCTRGVTGEKALEIQKRWRTPRELVEAYEALSGSADQKEAMVSDQMKALVGRKKVAKVQSKKIAEVWGNV